MKKDTIVQFVCFVTNLDLEKFAPVWEGFAKPFMGKKEEPSLQQLIAETKAKFRYVSQHEWPDHDLAFRFMNDRKSESFPEQQVRVVQIGGYVPLQFKKRNDADESQVRLIAFISHNEMDIDFYQQLPLNGHLNIFQAYYESCTYSYVLEFFVPEMDAEELMLQLKQRPGIDAGIYKEAFVPHI
jgi:hypothetical protein